MIKKYWPLINLVFLIPSVAVAADPFGDFLVKITTWVGPIIAISIACALIFFIWNAITLIRSSDESAREEAKKGMWWGIVALFVIVSIWGITTFLADVLGVVPTETTKFPKVE